MNTHCPYCPTPEISSGPRKTSVLFGTFRRRCDQSLHQRYRCSQCKRTYSTQTRNPCFRQKKRHLNPRVLELYASGISLRRMAFILRANRKTVTRKFRFLGVSADIVLQELRKSKPPCTEVEFDDLETIEHSKLKPLSVITMVEARTREILGFRVAKMPAKGLLAKRALKKYGRREDERKKKRRELFLELKPCIAEGAIIRSDENPHYKPDVKEFFPHAQHLSFIGRRGCVTGQGELKAGGFDPLFSLNHTYAMFRANSSRLFRKTWNTTKKAERLTAHLAIYALYHNLFLLQNPAR